MRKILVAAWLAIPVGTWAYHEGPGQDRLRLDQAGVHLSAAHAAAAAEDWATCIVEYEAAVKLLPAERRDEGRRARLELDKARMLAKQLPVAHADLAELVRELAEDATADAGLLEEARSAHANSQYYITWLMRLEGLPAEKWEPEIEAARQTYRLLAEQATARGDATALAQHQKDLESAVRLARMELKDLQGLPLPSQ